MDRLIRIKSYDDMPDRYRDSALGRLFAYHNRFQQHDSYVGAKLLIGMCMDHRAHLFIPDNFAYIIRAGGANLRYSEFYVSYAIAVGGVRAIALMAHTHCGMVDLVARRDIFVQGLMGNAGWERPAAEEQFRQFSSMYEIGDEVDFVLSESERLRLRYPGILVCPMMYKVEDKLLYLISEQA